MLRKVLILTTAVCMSVTMLAAQQTTGTVSIPNGTLLQYALTQPLDPATSKPGDDVPLRLKVALTAGGIVVLSADSVIHGTVTKVTHSRKHCAQGEVKWKVESILLPDGSALQAQMVRAYPYPITFPAACLSRKPAPGETAFYVLQDVAVAPLLPAAAVVEGGDVLLRRVFRPGACRRGEHPPLPINATIVVKIRGDHEVRY